jgi:chitinase
MRTFFLFLIAAVAFVSLGAQPKNNKFTVIAYYSGGPEQVDSLAAGKLTHIIFSFCHLKGNRLAVDSKRDSTTITKLVLLKKRHPSLKVMLSLGGWGGCAPCSEAFSTEPARKEFARSVLELNQYFGTDGIDLDWEYPTIEGYPGHRFAPEDKKNFTGLVQELRRVLGKRYEISFAAGGFKKFLDESVEWAAVMKEVDRVNLMTYDLINGYSTQTGHHTALYSRPEQLESTDHAVQYLLKAGIPPQKLVIGAAFYGRMWEGVPSVSNGLYQPGKFKAGIPYKKFPATLSEQKGFTYYWDDVAKAPYLYNATEKLFVTYDDKRSVELKTKYALEHRLNGIMFWELADDSYTDGLLDAIVSGIRH